MENNTCNICCDNYNKSTRSKVCCAYCDFAACRTCCETYILSENIPKCMNTSCAKEWSRKFIRNNFTNVFINKKFKEHMEDILFDKERSLLPATQNIVEEQIRKEKIIKEIQEIEENMRKLHLNKRVLEAKMYNERATVSKTENSYKYMRSCPADGCRGFLNTNWKCGICEKVTCSKCHELIETCSSSSSSNIKIYDDGTSADADDGHKCDPNLVETAKALDKETKPCPKCHTKIYKISGCDQMWCTICHTAFSWKTGNLEQNIHNPHYYEWQRKNGGLARAVGDMECGNELNNMTMEIIYNYVKTNHVDTLCRLTSVPSSLHSTSSNNMIKRYTYEPCINRLETIIRNTIHLVRVDLPRFNVDFVRANQDLRVKYLRNFISEDDFKTKIQQNDKKHRKFNEISQVIQLLNTAVTDIVFRVIDYLKKNNKCNNLDTFIDEFSAIVKYCNELLADISSTYKCVNYEFDEFSFKLLSVKEIKNSSSSV